MSTFLELEWHPGGFVAWAAVGLIAAWLAGKVVGAGAYGVLFDVALGLAGALLGGFVCSLLTRGETGVGGDTGFWISLAVASAAACLLIAGGRYQARRIKL
jgi:uncharacterized membrane protein YeaQ/YmgE (transglycosylase-associated protein family)